MYGEEMTDISFDVTKEEFEKIKQLAADCGMTMSQFVTLRLEQIFKEDKDSGYFKF